MIASLCRTTFTTILAVLALVASGQAQVRVDIEVDSLIRVGDYETTRELLGNWYEGGKDDLSPRERARLLLLRAQLKTDPGEAEAEYLAIALGYPATPEASRALLLLGQILHAHGDYERAANYLERLLRDYPNSPEVGSATLWLTQLLLDARRPNEACTRARRARGIEDRELRDLIEELREKACALAEGTEDRPYSTPELEATREEGRFAIQLGAFRRIEGAQTIAERVERDGYRPRIILLPGSSLHHVRVERATSTEALSGALRDLRQKGYDAAVVGDATRERPTH